MRKLIYYFALTVSAFVLHSCAEETILEQIAQDSEATTAALHEKISNTLENCNFDLANIKADTQKAISCLIDLKGQTIQLNNNVNLTYDGGDIINGTLIFKNGKIDGRLLNQELQVKGNATLIDPVFKFDSARWDLVQGRTSFRNALHNRLRLEELMNMVKNMAGDTFKIDSFDAYFEITEVTHSTNPNFYPSKEAINVPGHFSLVMSENTHLRVFPNSSKQSSLLAIRNVSHASIKGGILHGDRDEHNYLGNSSHEWGHLVDLHSATNTTVEGVKMINATGDGLTVHSLGFSFQSSYLPSHDILITNCVFDSARRNLLAISDGYNIIVENSEFYRAGIDTDKSKGTNPRFAIDIEAYRKRENGKLVLYEKVENVILRNNIERGSARGGFLVAVGDNITIENNTVESGIAYKYTNNTVIKNNRLIDRGRGGLAMGVGMEDSRTISNNKVIGNYIEGYDTGIQINGDDHLIADNIIKNCVTGISAKKISNSKVLNNQITSSNPSSRGIFVHYTSVNRVVFKNNYINVPNNPFRFSFINLGKGEELYCTHLVENEFNGSYHGLISKSNGVSLMKNKINTGLQIWNSTNSIVEDNVITSNNSDGIYLVKKNAAIELLDNIIDVPSNKQCVRIGANTSRAEIEEENNQCLN
jgi:parallel beta-helix repeat protein